MSDEIPANKICAEIIRTGIERRKRKAQSSLAQAPGSASERGKYLVEWEGEDLCIRHEWYGRKRDAELRTNGLIKLGVEAAWFIEWPPPNH